MANNQGKSIANLNVIGAISAPTDKLVLLFNAANSSIAQTVLIAVKDLFANSNVSISCSNLVMKDIRSPVLSSTELTVPQGTLFFSNSYGYFATANNYLKRFALEDF